MHVVAENYEQTHMHTSGTTTVTIIIKIIRSAEARAIILYRIVHANLESVDFPTQASDPDAIV